MYFIALALAVVTGTGAPAPTARPDPLEQSIQSVVSPFVAGTIVSLDCPAQPTGTFDCLGRLDQGGKFTVTAMTGTEFLMVTSIRYEAEPPSPLVRAVQEYLPTVNIVAVDCPFTSGTPDSFKCQAIHADGKSTHVRAGVQPDGSAVVYGTAFHFSREHQRLLRPIGAALMFGGILLLALALVQMYRLRQKSIVARLPLIAQQPVSFDSPGTYLLYAESDRFSMVFVGLEYSLVHEPTGEEVRSFPAIMRSRSSGWVRVRMALRRFFVQHPGNHFLRIEGIRGDGGTAAVLFSRAWGPRHYIWLVLAIGSFFLDVLGLVFFAAGAP